jgi:arabinoxylan arabinofuranohydrolase
MTSLGFEDALSPYKITPAEIACVLRGGCFITEKDPFTRVVTGITSGCIIGYKYFDFSNDFSSKTMQFSAIIVGMGCRGKIRILIDDAANGEEIGCCEFGTDSGVISTNVKAVAGRHSVFFVIEDGFGGWFTDMFRGRHLCELESFLFMK